MAQTQVDDKSMKIGGKQRIEALEGYAFPLSSKKVLPYLNSLVGPPDSDLENYPHVFFTSSQEWTPASLIMTLLLIKDDSGPPLKLISFSLIPCMMPLVISTNVLLPTLS